MGVFIDTSVFVGYLNTRDVHHKKAARLMGRVENGEFGEVFISDYFFDGIVTVVMLRTGVERAIEVGESILNSDMEILKVNDAVFAEAWEIFKRSEMSFTDCTIAAAVKVFQIDVMATFDRGFKKLDWINSLTKTEGCQRLLHSNTLRQISRLVNFTAPLPCGVIGEQLKRN